MDSDALFKVFREPQSGLNFVHYALEPKRLSVNEYEGKYYTTMQLNGSVTTPEGRLVYQFDKAVNVNLGQDEMTTASAKPFDIHDLFPLVPGDYKVSLLLKNEVSKEFTTAEATVRVPSSGGIVLSAPLLGYEGEPSKPDGKMRAFTLGGVKVACQPGRTFADELRGRVRVIAGLDQPPILFHSEAWPKEAGEDLVRLRTAARCGENDGLVVVWGPERDVHTAADEIRLRYVDAADGIPHETRQPFADGSTDFERILPGPDRMYPDTDSPPTRVTRERVDRLRSALPERPWEREARYVAAGIPVPVVHYLGRRGGAALVDRVVADAGADVRAAAFFFP